MDVMNFFDIVIHPTKVMTVEKKNVDLGKALKTFALVGAVIGFLVAIFFLGIVSFLGGTFLGESPVFSIIKSIGYLGLIIFPIVFAISSIISSGISALLNWFIAKLLGGKGAFEVTYYLQSRLAWPLFVIVFSLLLTLIVPIVGMISIFAFIMLVIYNIYLNVRLLSIANNISIGRAAAAYWIPIIITFLVNLTFIGL